MKTCCAGALSPITHKTTNIAKKAKTCRTSIPPSKVGSLRRRMVLKTMVNNTAPIVNNTPCHAGTAYPGLFKAIMPCTARAALYAVLTSAVCQPRTYSNFSICVQSIPRATYTEPACYVREEFLVLPWCKLTNPVILSTANAIGISSHTLPKLQNGFPTYAVGAILAISAIDSVENTWPTMTIRNIQIVPAEPPLESGTSNPIVVRTQPLPSRRE